MLLLKFYYYYHHYYYYYYYCYYYYCYRPNIATLRNFTCYGGRKQVTTKFNFPSVFGLWFLIIQFQGSSHAFGKVSDFE